MNRLFVAAVAAGMLGSGTVLGAGAAAAETALIVPGTGPSPYPALRALYHFNPATRPAIGEHYYQSAGVPREVIPYPMSVWPLTGVDSPTLGESVGAGTNNLDSAIRGTDGPIVVTGLSQGTLALNAEQARLANDPNAPAPDDLTFIRAADPNRLITKYFAPGTHLPVLGYTVQAPVESQYDTIDIVPQYDVFSDPLDRPGNVLALANALIAGGTAHTASAFTDPANVPVQDVTVTTNSKGATDTTYFIAAQELPLTAFLRQYGLSDGMAAQIDQTLRPMVDRAYGPPQPPAPLPRVALPAVNVAPLNAVPVAPVNAVPAAINAGRVLSQVRGVLPKGKR